MKLAKLVKTLLRDAQELSAVATGDRGAQATVKTALAYDSYKVTSLSRVRDFARQTHLIGANHMLRLIQTGLYGIELGKDVQLGHGVWFIHPLGIVIGGDAVIGDRVRFFGNNTIGTAKENGYPVLEDDVWVGAGARILGPIRIGARSVIGANAVVVKDVPPDSIATGIPAQVRPKAKTGALAENAAGGNAVRPAHVPPSNKDI